ncbi:hypothetical protein HY933_01565 [Candidatus Falkowbacteria bacterium]|nr:hypothetical protein [Candidatus Falkowbacteria bacterium]
MSPLIKNQNQNKIVDVSRVSFGIKTFNIAIICLIIVTGFLYLTQVNASAVKGYIIRDLEMKREEAKLANRKLELQAAGMQSVGAVSDKISQLGMVSADSVEYLQLPGGEVAVAR